MEAPYDGQPVKMLSRAKKTLPYVAAVAFLLLFFGVGIWKSSHPPQSPSQSRSAPYEPHPNYEAKKEAPEEAIARYNKYLAWFTAILALATIGLGIGTIFQIRLARAEFISTHRPQLRVRQFQIDPITQDHPILVLAGSPIRISFSVINAGDTNAVIRFIGTEVALWDGEKRRYELPGINPMVRPVTDRQLALLKSGQRAAFTAQSRLLVTESQSDAVDAGRLIIRCIGEITYADKLGTDRRTGFHRTYDIVTDTFGRSENPDEEYCD